MENFWNKLDNLVNTKEIIIDRLKGSRHHYYQDYIYPYDYGYLKGTTSSDGSGIDVWIGSINIKKVTALIVTFDSAKNDMENKLLVGCSALEIKEILKCHQVGDMIAKLVVRDII